MPKEKNIFDAAIDYDFGAVRRYVDSGNDLNICNSQGYSLLTCFVIVYDHAM